MKPWRFYSRRDQPDCNLLLQQPVRIAGEASSSPVAFGPGASAAAVPPEGGGADRRRICQPDV